MNSGGVAYLQFNYHRSRYRELIRKYGYGHPMVIGELIKNNWEDLFESISVLPVSNTNELYNLTVKVKGNNVQSPGPQLTPITQHGKLPLELTQ